MKDILDLDAYPMDRLESEEGRAFAARSRQQYVDSGLCLLSGLVHPDARELMAQECMPMAEGAFFHESGHNAYLTEDDSELPADHPSRRRVETKIGSIAYDELPVDCLLRQVYDWKPLGDFVAHVVGHEKLYQFADPLGACSVNVCSAGGKHGWHYDESEFTITVMMQAPISGGGFDYVHNLRDAKGEEERLARILDGDNSETVHLPFDEGSLLIFNGHNSLHQVTPVEGERLRLVPIFCFANEPNAMNSPEVRKMFWGRTG